MAEYVDFSYTDESGKVDTRHFHMEPELNTGNKGGLFYSAIKLLGLTGLALVDGKQPDGSLRHPRLDCVVELYYCTALAPTMRKAWMIANEEANVQVAFVLAVKTDPEDRQVVAMSVGDTTGLTLPARNAVF